jgi:hypothetical protein
VQIASGSARGSLSGPSGAPAPGPPPPPPPPHEYGAGVDGAYGYAPPGFVDGLGVLGGGAFEAYDAGPPSLGMDALYALLAQDGVAAGMSFGPYEGTLPPGVPAPAYAQSNGAYHPGM